MQKASKINIDQAFADIAPILKSGGVGVIPTDTLYGLVGAALNAQTVERIYKLRKRDLNKPMIILISSLKEMEKLGVFLEDTDKKFLKKNWPAKLSVVVGSKNKKFEYLTRGGKTLAFRMPDHKELIKLLKKTGPLVAPSANLSGMPPAQTYQEALNYFNDKVDFYLDSGEIISEPSTLIEVNKGKIKILRQGEIKIKV